MRTTVKEASCCFGRGSERLKNGSKVGERWPHTAHVTSLHCWPCEVVAVVVIVVIVK